MAKITKSVRMSDSTIAKIEELGVLLKEGTPDIIERAVEYLYQHRQEVYEQDVELRRSRIKATDKA